MISVVVAIYNGELYLRECLDSIVGQTYQDIEILLINDGSTDGSLDICNQYAKRDSRIRVISKNNEGESPTRNRGVSEATGEYIIFVDQDDVMHKNMLQAMYRATVEYDVDGVICSFRYVDEALKEMTWPTPDFGKNRLVSGVEAAKEYLTSVNIEGFPWNKLFKKSVFTNNNIIYKGDYPSDMFPSLQLCMNANSVYLLNEKLYDYRQLRNSLVHELTVEKCIGYEETIQWMREYSERFGLWVEADYFYTYRIINQMVRAVRVGIHERVIMKELREQWSYVGMTGCRNCMTTVKKMKKIEPVSMRMLLKIVIASIFFKNSRFESRVKRG